MVRVWLASKLEFVVVVVTVFLNVPLLYLYNRDVYEDVCVCA